MFLWSVNAGAEPVTVRHAEGVSHGFLRLRNEKDEVIANGEMTQYRRGRQVVARLIFRFRDGSTYDDTTIFTQQRQFRLVSNHVVQRGPAFPQPMDVLIDATSGTVTVRYSDKGQQKVETEHLDLPPDVANGLVPTLLKNLRGSGIPESFAYVAATPKPRLVKLKLSVGRPNRFAAGTLRGRATHYVLAVDLGGFAGVVAPILGKQPPDSHVWIIGGEAPGFLRAQQPFFSDGPLWTVELSAPQWVKNQAPTDH